MLERLYIRGFKLVEEAEMEPGPGLNVFSGETGAGKSMVLGALDLVLGGRADYSFVGESGEAVVECAFSPPFPREVSRILEEEGIPRLHDEPLVLRRVLSASGRSRCRVNGASVLLGVMRRLGEALVDVCGQNEHQSLRRPGMQAAVLDAFASERTGPLLERVGELVERRKELHARIEELGSAAGNRLVELDNVRYQLAEIESLAPSPEDYAEVEARWRLIDDVGRLRELTSEVYRVLDTDSEHSPHALLKSVWSAFEELAELDETAAGAFEKYCSALVSLEESASDLSRWMESLEFDEAEAMEVRRRYDAYARLMHKYGVDAEGLTTLLESLRGRLDELENLDARVEQLRSRVEKLEEELIPLVRSLSEARRKAASELGEAVTGVAASLGMAGARFEVRVEPRRASEGERSERVLVVDGRPCLLSVRGVDSVAFLFSANPGIEPQPLGRAASGGELSRVMLALKDVLAASSGIPTVVFDEIDAGVGGRTAVAVAGRLRSLAESVQCLCITHLPQIAAAAGTHFVVEKDGGRVSVRRIDGDERVEELARMLGGASGAYEHARELLRSGCGG